MAKKKWIVLPGGRTKRWKAIESDQRCDWFRRVPPHWFRNHLNHKERQKLRAALKKENAHRFPYIHPHIATWLYS